MVSWWASVKEAYKMQVGAVIPHAVGLFTLSAVASILPLCKAQGWKYHQNRILINKE